MLIALLCFVESQICAVLFKHYVQIMLHYALPVIETIMFLLKLMKIGKNKISYSSPPPCVARRRKFLVVQRDVNWLLILEIREWTMHSFQLFPQVSTVYNSVSTLVPHIFQLYWETLCLCRYLSSRPPGNLCKTCVPQEIFAPC